MSKTTYIQIAFVAAFLIMTMIGMAGCPGFWRGLRSVAVQCGPDLIKEVAGILVTPDWRATLEARAGTMGIDAINCAVQAVLKSLGEGAPDPHGIRARLTPMIIVVHKINTRVFNRFATDLVSERAQKWMDDHKVNP